MREKRFLGTHFVFAALLLAALAGVCARAQKALGVFEDHADVGTVLHAGSAGFDAAAGSYTLTASGENMWATADGFHFVWKKVEGDLTLSATVSFPLGGGNPHRKAAVIFRQSLDADSAYVDAAVHGVGLTSLQFRAGKGDATHEIEASLTAPAAVRLEKRGEMVYLYTAGADGVFRTSGASIRVGLKGAFYAGIAVCAHDKDAVEKAVFTHVAFGAPEAQPEKPRLVSALEVIPIASTDRRIVHVEVGHFEAPNWSRDGKWLIVNRDGRIWRLPVEGGELEQIVTGAETQCNNDHGLSPDGGWMAVSDSSQALPGAEHLSSVYVLPAAGGEPRRVTTNSPSYWHGWSPDGKTLVFAGKRDGDFDIYSIAVEGGAETRLTKAKGLDDGPEYAPGGKYIYFNSERSGHMQIWRMNSDGSEQIQVTTDERNNWFPHISPDGKWMVYVSYEAGVTGHPANKDVQLKLMRLEDGVVAGKTSVLTWLFGGQGTMNVPSWSPDSQRLAFVSYELIP